MSSFARYGDLTRRVGVPYVVLIVLARLPMAMTVFGTITFVTFARDSIADAGLVSGALAVATAIAQPLHGRWTQAAGQRGPLLFLAAVNAGALVALVAAGAARSPLLVLVGLGALVGLTNIPVGGLSRVRWVAVARSPAEGHTAMSLESVAEEITFVLGPALVGVVSAIGNPTVPLLIDAALTIVLVPIFALHALAPGPAGSDAAGSSMGLVTALRHVWVPVACMVMVGTFFGATQTSVSAVARALGEPSSGGLVYAVLGLGSAVSALSTVAIPARISIRARILLAVPGMFLATLAAVPTDRGTAPGSLVLLGALMVAAGVFIGVTLVSIYALVADLAPRAGVAVAMTAAGAASVAGVALGTSIAGAIAENIRPGAGFLASAAACVLLFALATRGRGAHDTVGDGTSSPAGPSAAG